MASQVEITEQDLDNLLVESADVLGLHHSDSRTLLCASVVLARAGQATPPGVYDPLGDRPVDALTVEDLKAAVQRLADRPAKTMQDLYPELYAVPPSAHPNGSEPEGSQG